MHITLVKKIKSDGSACKKCADVEQRLLAAGLQDRIDNIAIADERDPGSEGMQLARQYQVDRAPFFIVEDDQGQTKIYTIYFQLLKEVLGVGPR
jgi:hypothetical protein